MEDLLNKDESIKLLWIEILKKFGPNYFSLVNFWEGDNYAIGFKKKEKLIYLSTWQFKNHFEEGFKCFAEFELVDEETWETKEVVRTMDGISIKDLIKEMKDFIG